MSETIIAVENLSKRYLVGHRTAQGERYTALRDVIVRETRNFTRKAIDVVRGRQIIQGDEVEEFWALRNVSFEVKQGEVVGIIGRNGAGKSTLLKILSRITEPTEGRVLLGGRVASLLEVGTGFHPELTGRENIFLNGAILGMTRSEVRRKFDDIVAFAEVEKFLDIPVKHYSSGMYVRLAFAVAAHLEPDILIVDEVLAVGDANFQEKCLGKMKDVATSGRTVLFVSHNMGAVMRLTERAIVLGSGQVEFVGLPTDAVEKYLHNVRGSVATKFDVGTAKRRLQGTNEAKILSLRFDRASAHFNFLEPIRYIVRIRAEEDVDKIRVSMTIYSINGSAVGSGFSPEIAGLRAGEEKDFEISLPPIRFAPGSYYCGVAIGRGSHRTAYVNYDIVLDTLFFEVGPEGTSGGAMAAWDHAWGSISFPDLSVQRCRTDSNKCNI
jgi:lipopolysaccharide transport system ATP-binding protein